MFRTDSRIQAKIPDWRSKGKNELYSNTKSQQTSLVPTFAASPAVAKTLFSSPNAGTKTRSDWNITSERDKALLKVNIPQKLKHIEHADAAKAALAKFGTTPDKLAEGRDILSRDAVESTTPLMSPSKKKSQSRPAAAATSNASFPTQPQNVAPQFSAPKSDAAAFPPMPTRSPKPLSQSLNQSASTTAPTLLKPKSPTAKAGNTDVDYKACLTKFYEANAPAKVKDIDSTLQKYEGKEAEMFVSLAKKYKKQNALNEVFESRVKEVDKNDYLSLVTLYLKVFNPSRASGAEKLWAKNKGREATMFAELSDRWYTCNPLADTKKSAEPAQAPAPTAAAASASQPKPQNAPSASSSTPSPFASNANPFASNANNASAPSPFATNVKSAPAPSPFATNAKSSSASDSADSGANKIDYHKLLAEFYQKHNPQKISEVGKTLEKYKGREPELFSKLAQKYKTSNPLDSKPASTSAATPSAGTSFGFGNMTASLGASKSPFGGESPFGSAPPASSGASASMSSNTSENKSPFGAAPPAPAPSNSPFGSTSSSAFGTGTTLGSAPSPFGSASGSAFGGGAPAPATPFSSSAFGSTLATPGSAFGQTPTAPAATTPGAATGPAKFGGRNPRDILASFYQQRNPSKVNEVDKLLAKYAGREEQLFLNLAKKYALDPSMFGISASQPAAAAPSTGAATFGSPAAMGGGNTAGFGAAPPAGGFGSSGGAFGASGGFASAAAAQGGGFGSLASSPAGAGFGGFGGGGGGGAPSFGAQPTPFGAARR